MNENTAKLLQFPRAASDTRHRILETALNLIWRRSYGSVSVDDICRAAGVKKGSFYHFFSSKAQLTIEAMRTESDRIVAIIEQIFRPEVPPLDRFSELARGILVEQSEKSLELGHVSGCPFCSLGSELSGHDDEVRQAMLTFADRPLQLYAAAITEASQRGTIPPCDAQAKAHQIQAFIAGAMLEARLRNSLEPIRSIDTAIRSLLGVMVR